MSICEHCGKIEEEQQRCGTCRHWEGQHALGSIPSGAWKCAVRDGGWKYNEGCTTYTPKEPQ